MGMPTLTLLKKFDWENKAFEPDGSIVVMNVPRTHEYACESPAPGHPFAIWQGSFHVDIAMAAELEKNADRIWLHFNYINDQVVVGGPSGCNFFMKETVHDAVQPALRPKAVISYACAGDALKEIAYYGAIAQ